MRMPDHGSTVADASSGHVLTGIYTRLYLIETATTLDR